MIEMLLQVDSQRSVGCSALFVRPLCRRAVLKPDVFLLGWLVSHREDPLAFELVMSMSCEPSGALRLLSEKAF